MSLSLLDLQLDTQYMEIENLKKKLTLFSVTVWKRWCGVTGQAHCHSYRQMSRQVLNTRLSLVTDHSAQVTEYLKPIAAPYVTPIESADSFT